MERTIKLRNHLGLLVTALLAGACSRSPENILPKAAGSRPRECSGWPPGVPPAGAIMHRATWSSVIRDEHAQATLGVVLLELSFFSADGQTFARRACVETLGVDPRVAIAPQIVYRIPIDVTSGGGFILGLELGFQGPTRREGDTTLNPPEARHFVRFVAKGDSVVLDPELLEDARLLPAWRDVKLVFEDSVPRVEPAGV